VPSIEAGVVSLLTGEALVNSCSQFMGHALVSAVITLLTYKFGSVQQSCAWRGVGPFIVSTLFPTFGAFLLHLPRIRPRWWRSTYSAGTHHVAQCISVACQTTEQSKACLDSLLWDMGSFNNCHDIMHFSTSSL
jgi:hypothetical protein